MADLFEQVISETISLLPKEFKDNLTNVEILIEDTPTPEQIQKLKLRSDTSLFGLYEGVPQNVPGEDRAYLPDRITIFRKAIEEFYPDLDDQRKQIQSTLLHEIGHFFGMSEEQLQRNR